MKKHRDPLPEDLARALVEAFEPRDVAAQSNGLKERILQRVHLESASRERIVTVRADEGTWQPLAEGVSFKCLDDDGHRMTWLARMQPGARFPAHHHPDDEECLVLEGTVVLDDTAMAVGDYQMARAGSWHEEVRTETGCLLLLRSRSCRMDSPA